jgi:NtrC-family two-component system sensor histidine kinase KinB
MKPWRFGLRSRFFAAGVLLVLTTVAAAGWTLLVLSRLSTVAATTVRDMDEATATTSALSSALEREDDAMLVILGGSTAGHESLMQTRAVTDRALGKLGQDSSSEAQRRVASKVEQSVAEYRRAVDAVVAGPGSQPLERYQREANPLLRQAVAGVVEARDQRFEGARVATALARDEVTRARGVVMLISGLAVAIAAVVALRLARHVIADVTQLARLDEMRTELVAVASHELRTPVTTLRMSLLMLREMAQKLDARVRDLVDNALGGVDLLGETVDELLDMTRIEAGHLKLNADSVNVLELIQETARRHQVRADELGLRLDVHAPPEIPSIIADRVRLRVVIDNIVNNSLKYTPRGGFVAIHITPRRSGQLETVEVAVTDSGCGIPIEFQSRVFEKFFRVEHHAPSSEAAPRGSGIGLYLCKEIVELHGGRIRCERPELGHGTRIAFELPIQRPTR